MRRRAQPIDRKVMREINQNTLLNLIRAHAPISRTQLMEMSGLSFGTVVGITSILIENQLVIERGVAESTGGRKAGLLEVFPDGGYTIGISLKEYTICGVMLNLLGDIVCSETWEAQLRDNGDHAVEEIAAGVERFIERCNISKEKIIGLGCGVSGVVDAKAGVSVDSWILNWHGVCLGPPLAERLGISVFVENAVDCLASYEKLFGHGQNYHDFMLVSLGRGLGLSLVVRNEVYRGGMGQGAEFGHIPFIPAGRTCECGNAGCLEEYVADRGIWQTYKEVCADLAVTPRTDIDTLSIDLLFDAALQGDAAAIQTFERTGAYLGIGLSTLINLFNPECLILYGGEDRPRLELLLAPMKVKLQQHVFSRLGRDLVMQMEPDLTMDNWARGAGCVVLRRFFAVSTAAG